MLSVIEFRSCCDARRSALYRLIGVSVFVWMAMAELNRTEPFKWTPTKKRAAILVAEDELSDWKIAKECHVSKVSLEMWKRHPEFMAEVGDHIGQIQASALKFPIAKKHNRIATLNLLWQKALNVIAIRAQRYAVDGDMQDAIKAAQKIFGNANVPEAMTGLLVKKETPTNAGRIATEWMTDVALMREIRSLQQDAAKELGQWSEKAEINHTGISFADLFTLVSANQGASSGGLGRDG
jgi:hypothetical protein